MRKIISILTATRAEYGLLKPFIIKLNKIKDLDVRVVVTGAHMSPEFGLTYQEIEKDGVFIDEKIEILLSADTPSAISKSMGLAMISFSDYFDRLNPHMLLVLGDRYETLAVAAVAMNQRIPIAHLYGGETTEGALDESIRHAISKLSYLHFTSTDEYRNRVIQLGESPDRVFSVGAVGIENIMKEKLLSKSELELAINFKLDKAHAMITFHPVTLEGNNAAKQFRELLSALEDLKDMKFIFSKANADADGRVINQMIDDFVIENKNAVAFTSLGLKRYLSVLKYTTMVIGNSSSGLIEAPSFGVPTINIGDRQKGRLQAESVIDCKPTKSSIKEAIDLALSENFKDIARNSINPYGDGNTTDKVVEVLEDYLTHDKISLKKVFYDCEVMK